MSMGYLLPSESAPVVWRGLMVMKALQQLLHEVDWGGLDILVLDMPPGTGDVQLTVGQQVILDGAVIVSTPQDVALKDAVKGIHMFRKMSVPILGMVQNMSVFTCSHCGHATHIFPPGISGGGISRSCHEHGIEFLGDIPLDAQICVDADRGVPTVVSEGQQGGERVRAFLNIAEKVANKIGLKTEH
jgi:ATP-binding protein involved in chromosome partitioning